jgi:glycosyltransferase involved in cell wall biosynthesis
MACDGPYSVMGILMSEPHHSVVLLADRITDVDQAGAIRAYVDLLEDRGFATRIVCASWSAPSGGKLDIEECPGLGDRFRMTWALRSLRRPEGPARPTLLHSLQARVAPAALEIAERWEVPYLQGVEEFLPFGSRLRLSRRWCRGLVATSRELGDDLARNFGVPADWVRVVHRGLEPAEPILGRWNLSETRVSVVGAAGPLSPGSGFPTFLNAARRVLDAGVDAEFILVGEGEEEGDLRRRADRLRLTDRLTFAGDAAYGLSFWNILDVYCQPSTRPTVGRNLARAMVHGIPAVASDIEGLRALIAHGSTGLRVPTNDTNALARGILDLLADRPRASRLGLAAREAVLHDYDLVREANTLAALYRSIIDSGPTLEPETSAAS